jgi:hypothetical protein
MYYKKIVRNLWVWKIWEIVNYIKIIVYYNFFVFE